MVAEKKRVNLPQDLPKLVFNSQLDVSHDPLRGLSINGGLLLLNQSPLNQQIPQPSLDIPTMVSKIKSGKYDTDTITITDTVTLLFCDYKSNLYVLEVRTEEIMNSLEDWAQMVGSGKNGENGGDLKVGMTINVGRFYTAINQGATEITIDTDTSPNDFQFLTTSTLTIGSTIVPLTNLKSVTTALVSIPSIWQTKSLPNCPVPHISC